ncbi:CAP domain-containing protein [Corynebacterium sp. Marseille-P4321]|uniref:CAP domain-containing protein n=1 Tax=Corynebacterium sp. Marseille-P4321 TaxID=2736603 RepID=UPI00158B94C8|nr:CAP domain-containing protein [Corynebacterium sp. Marseille-P4321]
MYRSRIPAVALAVALPLAAVQVVPAPVAAVEQSATSIPQQTEKRARLAAQAIEELINEYRVANGLHPLVTHELYDAQALAWSKQMVSDLPTLGYPRNDSPLGEDGSAFRHSDPAEWGHSGENILFDNGVVNPDADDPAPGLREEKPFQDTEEDWARAAAILFEDWRNSPTHNANMLAPEFQGMGLGLVLADKGVVWGTTMFFIDNTPLQGAGGKRGRMARDPLTARAVASGEPFYTPSGARELLGIGAVADPTDTKGHVVSREVDFGEQGIFEVIAESEFRTGPDTWEKLFLDKTKDAPQGLDPEVTGTKIQAEPVKPTSTPKPSTPKPSTPKPTTPKPSTPKPSTPKPTTPKPTSATPTSTTKSPASAPKTSDVVVTPTGGQGSVDKQSPTPTPTGTTTSTTTSKEPKPVEPNPKDEGSSKAGIAIGVVLGLLAVIGIAAAALPMVAPDLARQLGIPGA